MVSVRVYKIDKRVAAELQKAVILRETAKGLDTFVSIKGVDYQGNDDSARLDVVVHEQFAGLDLSKPEREQGVSGPVTRDMLCQLFDLMGKFPHSGVLPHEVSMPLLTLLSINERVKEKMRQCEDGDLIRDVEHELSMIDSYVRELEDKLLKLL